MLDKLSPRADEMARESAEAWVNAFGLALARSEELDAGGADVTTAYKGLDHVLSESFGEDLACPRRPRLGFW